MQFEDTKWYVALSIFYHWRAIESEVLRCKGNTATEPMVTHIRLIHVTIYIIRIVCFVLYLHQMSDPFTALIHPLYYHNDIIMLT